MTRANFGLLDVVQQEELIDKYGWYIRTQLIENYLCDVYLYDTFYVVFYYLINKFTPIKSKCFASLDYFEHFIDVVERFHR